MDTIHDLSARLPKLQWASYVLYTSGGVQDSEELVPPSLLRREPHRCLQKSNKETGLSSHELSLALVNYIRGGDRISLSSLSKQSETSTVIFDARSVYIEETRAASSWKYSKIMWHNQRAWFYNACVRAGDYVHSAHKWMTETTLLAFGLLHAPLAVVELHTSENSGDFLISYPPFFRYKANHDKSKLIKKRANINGTRIKMPGSAWEISTPLYSSLPLSFPPNFCQCTEYIKNIVKTELIHTNLAIEAKISHSRTTHSQLIILGSHVGARVAL
ncbi:hypothetical protein SODALDRAFT_375621 [Sodiomyces alkalinus F11]|uniref:Uncharacterized protein n=1 Tax=Sodiomyces alkalinus (strain CBS 110278 / VKM F-3762 / F11) TaxID=1314773 RepID=A0A3N2Q9W5_SODAK|nr:hypothetical protein SODALDRAFT_375621 [Sodiomyces alkalinus F11]ROT43448.1 hypothetical protein SODALDRAFT_375621 [Sodiomyces alkalinus F11]